MEVRGASGIAYTIKQLTEVPIDLIRPFEGQPREHFGTEDTRALSESLKASGQMDPIMLIRIHDDKRYTHELVDGERRYRSAKVAGKETLIGSEIEIMDIPGVDRKDVQFTISALRNFGHKDHEPLEESRALARIQDKLGKTQAELAAMFGHPINWVQKRLNLLKLCPTVQKLMSPNIDADKRLSPASALRLVGLPEQTQVELALQAVENGWTESKLAQAIRNLIREGTVVKEGVRKRAASDDFGLIESAVNYIDTRLASINDVPFSTIANVIRGRGPQSKAALYTTLKRNAEILQQLADKVNRIDMETAKNMHMVNR